MAISTLGELKAAVATTMNRTDQTTSIPEFINLAWVDINSRFRTADMQTSAAITMTAGSPTVALPANFGEMIRFEYVAQTGDVREIKQAPFSPITQLEERQQNGFPEEYSILGGDFYIKPTPESAFTGTVHYFRSVPNFTYTDDSSTNWLLASYPNVWLYGALVSALPKIGPDVRRDIWSQFYEAGLNNVQLNDRSKRFSKAPRMRSAIYS